MASIYSVTPTELIEKAAVELKKDENFKAPEWTIFVKTGVHKERVPQRSDWWHVRVAAILRSVYKLGPIGTQKLRVKYGGRKSRGVVQEEFRRGSGSVIRKALQQLEKAGLIKQMEIGVHKGRVVTPQGKSFLDKLSVELIKVNKSNRDEEPVKTETKKQEVKTVEPVKEEKIVKKEETKKEATDKK
jgi:small subunit ribosomal protein S19e